MSNNILKQIEQITVKGGWFSEQQHWQQDDALVMWDTVRQISLDKPQIFQKHRQPIGYVCEMLFSKMDSAEGNVVFLINLN